MILQFVGAAHEVTGSCHYLHVGDKHILVDYGMEQGRDLFENMPLPVEPHDIDYIFATHAHIDHTGMIPALYHKGFAGRIISTGATKRLCDIMLRDSAHIQAQDAMHENEKAKKHGLPETAEPAYTMEDVIAVMHCFDAYGYNEIHELCEGVKFRFTDVGHLLGSASIEMWLKEGDEERKICFSGDIGNVNQPLLRDPQTTDEADYVLIESTYGNRYHEKSKGNHVEQIADAINDTMRRGGNLVIPAFAVGRTQAMLYFIRQIKENNMVPDYPDFPVYVDSPLAVDATSIFEDMEKEYLDEEALEVLARGKDPISFKNLHLTITVDESMEINNDPEPKVIISSSGMCDAGRIRHHIKYNISRPESTILFVGYQSPASLGRKIIDGDEEVRIFGTPYPVRAQVAQIDGMSGHADKAGLLNWINAFKTKPKQVFVVHGEGEVTDEFASVLHDEYGFNAAAPYSGSVYDLIKGEFVKVTEGIPIQKPEPVQKTEEHWTEKYLDENSTNRIHPSRVRADSYTKLKLAENRLRKVIAASSGLPNKDLDKFARAINDLCGKYGL